MVIASTRMVRMSCLMTARRAECHAVGRLNDDRYDTPFQASQGRLELTLDARRRAKTCLLAGPSDKESREVAQTPTAGGGMKNRHGHTLSSVTGTAGVDTGCRVRDELRPYMTVRARRRLGGELRRRAVRSCVRQHGGGYNHAISRMRGVAGVNTR